MKKIFHLALLLFTACGQKSANDKSLQIKDTTRNGITKKHLTFNETIDSLPNGLREFIPVGYSAIKLSSGDANWMA